MRDVRCAAAARLVAISLIDHVLSATANDDRVTRQLQQQQQQRGDVTATMLRDTMERLFFSVYQ